MKIKTVKEMRLDELIKWGYENGIKNKAFRSNEDNAVLFDGNGWIFFENFGHVNPNERFKVEVEEDITENTVLKRVACVHKDTNNISCYNDASIKKALHLGEFDNINYKQIYLQNDDGSIGELIWKDGKMVGGSEG